MANQFYDYGRNEFLLGNIDWVDDTINAVLVDTADYTVDIASDMFLSGVDAAGRVATQAISGQTGTSGIADAGDTIFSSVTGDTCEAVVLYKDTGNEDTSPLIAYIDSGTNLPVTPNSGNITIQWASTINKIFKL